MIRYGWSVGELVSLVGCWDVRSGRRVVEVIWDENCLI